MRFCGFEKEKYEQLLEMSDQEKFELISDFIIYLKKERKVFSSLIHIAFLQSKDFINQIDLV
jgi:hypothetical protein